MNRAYLFLTLLLLVGPLASRAQDTLTVASGTASSAFVPIYGNYMDEPQHSQMIYPDAMLADMRGHTVSHIIFQANQSGLAWTAPISMSIGVTTANDLTASFLPTPQQQVFQGTLALQGSALVIALNTPFLYPDEGGNLLIDFAKEGYVGNAPNCHFLGASLAGLSRHQSSTYDSLCTILPQASFVHTSASGCGAVTNLQVVSITGTSATLTWTPLGSASEWLVEYDTQDFTPGQNAAETEQAFHPYITLQNLEPGTMYYVYVTSVCDNDDLSASAPITFRTVCAESTPVPYTENFAGYANHDIPACWTVLTPTQNTFPNNGPVDAPCVMDGQLQFYDLDMGTATGDLENLIASPRFEELQSLQVSFRARAESNGYRPSVFSVGVVDDNDNYTPYQTITLTTTYQNYTVTFANFGGESGRIGFFASRVNPDWNGFSVFVDDVAISYDTSLCLPPTHLRVDTMTANTLSLSWTDQWETGSYILAWGLTDDPDSALGSVALGAVGSYTISGLSDPLHTHAWIRTDCGSDTSRWSPIEVVPVSCDPITEMPWNEDFNIYLDGELPPCWRPVVSLAGYPSVQGGELVMHVQDRYGFGTDIIVGLPLTAYLSGRQLSFWAQANESTPNFMVGVLDAHDQFIAVDTLDISHNRMPYVVMLSRYVGLGTRLAFRCEQMAPLAIGEIVIDDLEIDYASDCPRVVSPRCLAATATTATLSWHEIGSAIEWEVAYGTAPAADPATLTTVTTTTCNPFVLSYLQPSTHYYIYVRPICGSGDDDRWTLAPIEVDTRCEAVDQFPLVEGFAAGVLPACWSLEGDEPWSFSAGEASFSTPSNAAQASRLVMPLADLTALPHPTLAFTHKQPAAFIGTDELLVYASPDAGATWTLLFHDSLECPDFRADTVALPFRTATCLVAFEGISHYGDGVHLSQVELFRDESIVDPCLPVTGLELSQLTYNYALATWEADAEGEQFELQFKHADAEVWTEYGIMEELRVQMISLNPETDYMLRLRRVCDVAHFSEWDTLAFTTPAEPCPTPTGLSVSNIATTSATIDWMGEADAWEVIYISGAIYAEPETLAVESHPVALTGLEPDKFYMVAVRARCANGQWSPVSSALTFATLPTEAIDEASNEAIRLYPNPTRDRLCVEGYEGEVLIVDLQGRVAQRLWAQSESQMRLNLPAGTYFVKMGATVRKLIVR